MELDCGIRRDRIVSWLDGELSLPRDGERWVYVCEGAMCRIEAKLLPQREFKHVALDRTLVTINGDDAAINEFYHLFTLRFISAGG